MKYLYLCFISLFTSVAHAAGVINFLELENDVVLFSTAEDKTSYPACVNNDQTQLWSLSLSTDMGRAAYSLILTSMAKGDIALSIESAQDCGVLDGVERAQKITLVNSASSQSYGTRFGVYGGEGERLGTLMDLDDRSQWRFLDKDGIVQVVTGKEGRVTGSLYYTEDNCAGTPYTTLSGLMYHKLINDGFFYERTGGKFRSNIRSVKVLVSEDALECRPQVSSSNVYEVDFNATHYLCGRKNCYLKEE